MSALGRLTASVVLDTAEFTVGTDRAKYLAAQLATTVDKSMRDMESSVKSTLGSVAGALGIAFSADYFVGLIKGTIDALDHLENLSKSTNITASNLAGLKLLADSTGTNLDSMAKAVDKMTVNMGKSPQAFIDLGITSKDTTKALQQLADLFNALPDIAQRNALAQKVFGKTWDEMAPALSKGGAQIGELIAKGKELSGVTDESAKQANKFSEQVATLTTTLGATKTKIIGEALPAMNDIAKAMQAAAEKGGLLLAAWVALGSFWPAVFGGGSQATASVNQMGDQILALQARIGDLRKEAEIAQARGAPTRGWEVGIAQSQAQIDALRLAIRAANGEFQDQVSRMMNQGQGKPPPDDAAAARAAAFLKQAKVDLTSASDSLIASLEKELIKINALSGESTKYAQALLDIAKLKKEGKPVDEARILSLAGEIDSTIHARLESEAYFKVLDELDAVHEKSIDTTRRLVEKMADENDKFAFENTLIGKTKEQQALLNIEFERAIALRGKLNPLELDAINNKFNEKAAIVAAGQALTEQSKLWTDLAGVAGKFFGDLFVNGKSAFDRLRTELKAFLQELIALFAQKWILQLAGGVIGGTAGGALANAAGSVGANTLGGAANSFIGTGVSAASSYLFGSAGTATAGGMIEGYSTGLIGAGGFAATIGTAAGSVATAFGASAAASAAFAETVAAAIPVIGWIVAIGAVLYTIFGAKPGAPKQGGSFLGAFDPTTGAMTSNLTGTLDRSQHLHDETQQDPAAQAAAAAIGTSFAATLQRLGGTSSGFQFGLGWNSDPGGSAPSMASSLVRNSAGQTIFEQQNRNVGRKPEELQAEIQLQSERALLAALKASSLPDYLSRVFNGLTPATATLAQIDNAIQTAIALKDIFGTLSRNPMKDVAAAVANSSNQFDFAMKNNAATILSVARAYDGTLASTQNLATATTQYYNAQLQLILGITQAKSAIDGMFDSTFRNIKLAGMDKQGQYNFYQQEAADLQAQALASNDPATIQRLSQQINSDISSAFSLLTPEEQRAQSATFLSAGRATQSAIDARLEKIQKDAVDATQKTLEEIKTILKMNSTTQQTAADTQVAAAATNLAAAQTPRTLILQTPGGGQQVTTFGGG